MKFLSIGDRTHVSISLSAKVLYKHQYKDEASLRLFLIEIQLLYRTQEKIADLPTILPTLLS